MRVQAVQFEEVKNGPHRVEFGKNGDKLIFHFFKDGLYPMSFRARLFSAFVNVLNLHGREKEMLEIDWVEEFQSWCVILPDITALTPPPSEETIKELLSKVLN